MYQKLIGVMYHKAYYIKATICPQAKTLLLLPDLGLVAVSTGGVAGSAGGVGLVPCRLGAGRAMRAQLVEQVHDLPVQSLGLVLYLTGQQHRVLVGGNGLLLRQASSDPLLHARGFM